MKNSLTIAEMWRDHEYPSDIHHILFQRKHWQQGYAKVLREHDYMKIKIPTNSLHSLIHSKIHDVPCPNRDECREAYREIDRLIGFGYLDPEYDSLADRIDFLIWLWKRKCPATVAVLEWQKQIVADFYEGGGK